MRTKLLVWGLLGQAGCAVAGNTAPADVAVDATSEPTPSGSPEDPTGPPEAGGGGLMAPTADAGTEPESVSPDAGSQGTDAEPAATDTPASPTPVAAPGGRSGEPAGTACAPEICGDGTQATGVSCAQALTIGRGSLLAGSPEYVGSTLSSEASQDLDLAGCEDEGNDVFHRIYLFPGEVLNLSVRNQTTGYDPTVKFYFGGEDCSAPSEVLCIDEGPKNVSELIYQQPALGEGWHYIVVDGPAGAAGQFSISKSAPLSTVEGACSC